MTEGNEPARHPRAHRADRSDRRAQASRLHGGLSSAGFLTALNDGIERGSSLAAPAAARPRLPGTGGAQGPWPPPRARSASPSSRPAPTTAPRSPSTAPPRRAAASGRGAPTSPHGPRRRPASRSARPGRASARSARSTAGPSAPAAPRRPAPACSPTRATSSSGAGDHIGIVESVDADGSIHTIEGNSSNAVSRRTYGARRRRRHGLRAARLSARPRARSGLR